MSVKKVVFDVFTGESALGNPCAVVMLDEWLSDTTLLEITRENDQPVTSFVCEQDDCFHVRWFSRDGEINLCGHGSLGAGAAILSSKNLHEVTLLSDYGNVIVKKQNGLFGISLPAWKPQRCALPNQLFGSLQGVSDVFGTRDLVIVLADETSVSSFKPDFSALKQISDFHAVILTAQSSTNSYVLRYFAPSIGINEDLATGSAHCSLAPYWFEKLNIQRLSAQQLSVSGGYFQLEQEARGTVAVYARVNER